MLAACVLSAMCALGVITAPTGVRAADTLEGEILDMACYLDRGARGPAHKRCAQMCAEHGMPLGLITDEGKVFLLYPKHGAGKAFDAVKTLAGARAKVTGKLGARDGINGLEVHAAEGATPE